MLKWKYSGIIIFIILIFAIGSVSALEDANITDQAQNDECLKLTDTDELSDAINGGTFDDIQDAIDNAWEGDVIELNGTFTSTGSEIVIDKSITINGNGKTVLDAENLSNFFVFRWENKNVTLNGLTFINSISEYGIHNEYMDVGNYKITNCNFKDNNESYLINLGYEASLEVSNCNFTNNTDISMSAPVFNLKNSNFIKNTGSIRNAIITNCNFTENYYEKYMGFIQNADLIDNCNFIRNSAWLIPFIYDSKTIRNSVFKDNTIKGMGLVYKANNVVNSIFENNYAKRTYNPDLEDYDGGFGGALYDVGYVANCVFKNNKADIEGGAIEYAQTVRNCIFDNNYASQAGALYGASLVENCNFTNNRATGYGGAAAEISVVKNSNFINNHAVGKVKNYAMHGGGAIYNWGGITVDNCNFIGNTIDTSGAAILIATILEPAKVVITNSRFTNNVAKGNFETVGYLFKNYANGVIYNIGDHDLKITFKNCKGLNVKNTDKFKLKSKIKASHKKKTLTVKVMDKIYSKPLKALKVKIKINKKTYKKTTDKKGMIKFSTKKLPHKKYKVKITYPGDNYILKSSKALKIKV